MEKNPLSFWIFPVIAPHETIVPLWYNYRDWGELNGGGRGGYVYHFFRRQKRLCHEGCHSAELTCTGSETVLLDKIITLPNTFRTYHQAIEYCSDNLDGQLWGDFDVFPEATRVIYFIGMFSICGFFVQTNFVDRYIHRREL